MISLQPRSPLFPYTTLFRSVKDVVVEGPASLESEFLVIGREAKIGVVVLVGKRCHFARIGAIRIGDRQFKDRKSTRLNSSHANISYAVFCLKKKKKTKDNNR